MNGNAPQPAQGAFYWLTVAVLAAAMMVLTSPWWAGGESWKIAAAGGLSGLVASVGARAIAAWRAGRGR